MNQPAIIKEGEASSPEPMPCPFCGGTELVICANAVDCTGCDGGVSLDWTPGMDGAEAIAAWNRRAAYAESEGVREALLSSVLLEALKGALCFGCGVRFGNNSVEAMRHARGCVACGPARAAISQAEAVR